MAAVPQQQQQWHSSTSDSQLSICHDLRSSHKQTATSCAACKLGLQAQLTAWQHSQPPTLSTAWQSLPSRMSTPQPPSLESTPAASPPAAAVDHDTAALTLQRLVRGLTGRGCCTDCRFPPLPGAGAIQWGEPVTNSTTAASACQPFQGQKAASLADLPWFDPAPSHPLVARTHPLCAAVLHHTASPHLTLLPE